MNLNRILRSICRRRILKVLSKKQELSMMKLVQKVNSTYNEVDRNLLILISDGLVAQRYLGRRRIVSLNFENKKTSVVLRILDLLSNPTDLEQLERKLELITNTHS